MTPKVSKLVDTFLAATGMRMSLHIVRECWPMLCDDIPQQNLEGVHRTIIKHLDEVATCKLSLTAWDTFAFPAAEEEHWKEDCLSYYLSKVVNIGAQMPGIWLVVQDMEGHYGKSMYVLLYEATCLHMTWP